MDYANQSKTFRSSAQEKKRKKTRTKPSLFGIPLQKGLLSPRRIILALCILFLFFLGVRYWWREMRWRYIVIHHTAADSGSLAFYRKLHQDRWGDLAYHIIINNGSDNTAVGQIEYSQRWIKRQHHYSTKKSYLNYFGIAIALTGNFENYPIPLVQKQTLVRLLSNLGQEYNIPPERIIGHREVQNTKCPGAHVNMVEIRTLVKQKLEASNNSQAVLSNDEVSN